MREGGVQAARNLDGSRGHSSPSKFVGTLEWEWEREGEWGRREGDEEEGIQGVPFFVLSICLSAHRRSRLL